jgi:hypothetical protein
MCHVSSVFTFLAFSEDGARVTPFAFSADGARATPFAFSAEKSTEGERGLGCSGSFSGLPMTCDSHAGAPDDDALR